MRRLMYGLLAVLVSFGAIQAKEYTNKTFLMPRSHVDNMAMEYSTWHKLFRMIDDDMWGGTVGATGFYQSSQNEVGLGRYFGKFNSATGPNITNPYAGSTQDFIWVLDRQPLATGLNEEALLLDQDFIIHDFENQVTDPLAVRGVLRPRHTSYGLRLDYHQKLDKLAKGLYVKVSAPLVHVKNKIDVCYTGTNKETTLPYSTTKVKLSNYLGGNLAITGTQEKLCKAKICGSNDESGIADIEVTLGYNFLYKEHKHCGVYASLTIPTSDTPTGEWLFEPVIGHAGHWAIGLGIDSAFELWQHGEKSLEFIGALHYKYVLNKTEMRTLGFKYPCGEGDTDPNVVAGKFVPMGWYMLGGQVGKAGTFPLANVLTQRVGVEPGSQLELLASFAFNWGNFTFDLGYNLFAKERESVMLKNCTWTDQTYAIADPSYDPSAAFAVGNIWNPANISADANKWINKKDLVTDTATTPVYVTHKIFSGFGYSWHGWDYPLTGGIGASWEFGQGTNAVLDGYALWAKLGIAF
ncbi:hypothetical protein KKA53_00505 [Candidatus Dependentiae bacterium]|nr:hypothetical protein [Candidatus Dependentiae bacterium]